MQESAAHVILLQCMAGSGCKSLLCMAPCGRACRTLAAGGFCPRHAVAVRGHSCLVAASARAVPAAVLFRQGRGQQLRLPSQSMWSGRGAFGRMEWHSQPQPRQARCVVEGPWLPCAQGARQRGRYSRPGGRPFVQWYGGALVRSGGRPFVQWYGGPFVQWYGGAYTRSGGRPFVQWYGGALTCSGS